MEDTQATATGLPSLHPPAPLWTWLEIFLTWGLSSALEKQGTLCPMAADGGPPYTETRSEPLVRNQLVKFCICGYTALEKPKGDAREKLRLSGPGKLPNDLG